MTHLEATQKQMYGAILQSPKDDTVRLVYADVCDEIGGELNTFKAEFIRKSIELYNLGKPRQQVTGIAIPKGNGFTVVTGENDSEEDLVVGQRIDFYNEWFMIPSLLPGLLVAAIKPDDPLLETVRLTLVKDEYSVLYPQEQVNTLTRRIEEIDRKWGESFVDGLPLPDQRYYSKHLLQFHVKDKGRGFFDYILRFSRGFLSKFRGIRPAWNAYGSDLMKLYPITDVQIINSIYTAKDLPVFQPPPPDHLTFSVASSEDEE